MGIKYERLKLEEENVLPFRSIVEKKQEEEERNGGEEKR